MSNTLLSVIVFLALVASSAGIKCWTCGQYSDGVGSITPCANKTAAKLTDCPAKDKYCIKYVSELTVVRDCVTTCAEKEWWGARTFCCDTDECNSGNSIAPALYSLALSVAAVVRGRH